MESKEGGEKEKETKENTAQDGILETLWNEANSETSYTRETASSAASNADGTDEADT